jgi:hypothetical protein
VLNPAGNPALRCQTLRDSLLRARRGLSSESWRLGSIETAVDHDSSRVLRGTIEDKSTAVPYIDVRQEHAETALDEIDRYSSGRSPRHVAGSVGTDRSRVNSNGTKRIPVCAEATGFQPGRVR